MVTYKKLSNMAILAFKNGLRLHADSIVLFNNGSYASSVMLSILSMEEFGKYFSLSAYVFYSRTSGYRDEKKEDSYIKLLYNHPFKQKACFGRDGFDMNDKTKVKEKVNDRFFENIKQRSVYVGFERDKGQLLYANKINDPSKITKRQANEQVRFLNGLLIDMTDQHIKDIFYFDENEINKILNMELMTKLNNLID